jgi:hypothetical protein
MRMQAKQMRLAVNGHKIKKKVESLFEPKERVTCLMNKLLNKNIQENLFVSPLWNIMKFYVFTTLLGKSKLYLKK